MGANKNKLKHGDDYINSNSKTHELNSSDSDQVSESEKLSPLSFQAPDQVSLTKSKTLRYWQYPKLTVPLRREIHAPTRSSRSGFPAKLMKSCCGGSVKESSGDEMVNCIPFSGIEASASALKSLRCVSTGKDVGEGNEEERKRFPDLMGEKKLKEVIDLDNEVTKGDVELVEIVVDRIQRESPITWKNSGETKRFADGLGGEFDVKGVEGVFLQPPTDSLSSRLSVGLHVFYSSLACQFPNLLVRLSGLFSCWAHQLRRTYYALPDPFRLQKKSDAVKKDQDAFRALTKDEEDEVHRAFQQSNRRTILVSHKNSDINITVELLSCLMPGAWLNDEVINLYLELLKEREKREPRKFLKCHFFNTFFYQKLISGRGGYDFKSVRRWTSQKKLGYCLLDCDKIFVPIHKGNHWCLAIIDKKDRKFQYLDSLKGINTQVTKVLARYYVDEVKDKTGKDIDVSSWRQEHVEDLPLQKNGFDCGVFIIKYADFHSRGIGLCFDQEDMPYFRMRTAKEILRQEAY